MCESGGKKWKLLLFIPPASTTTSSPTSLYHRPQWHLVPGLPSHCINYCLYAVRHWFTEGFKLRLSIFSQQRDKTSASRVFKVLTPLRGIRKIRVVLRNLALEEYPCMLNWIQVWRVGWMVGNINIVACKKSLLIFEVWILAWSCWNTGSPSVTSICRRIGRRYLWNIHRWLWEVMDFCGSGTRWREAGEEGGCSVSRGD